MIAGNHSGSETVRKVECVASHIRIVSWKLCRTGMQGNGENHWERLGEGNEKV